MHEIDTMLHNGQIQEKDAAQLKEEIDDKLYFLKMNPPVLSFNFQPSRIVHYSDLSGLFKKDQLKDLFKNQTYEEKLFKPKEEIASLGKP